MMQRIWWAGMLAGMICAGAAGCSTQDKTAQETKGSYIHARHMQVGSNIPQPNRGASGSSDTAEADLEREQFQKLQTQSGSFGMPREGGPR